MNIISLLVVNVLASFSGFIDSFSENQSRKPATYILKGLALFFISLNFVVRCIKKSFSGGKDRVYLHEIITKYIKSLRFFPDCISIIFVTVFISYPDEMAVGGVLFFYSIIPIFIANKDFIFLQISYLPTHRYKLAISLFKIVLLNIFFAHFWATILLAMARIDPTDNWLIAYDLLGD